ncbi:MAG: PilZ domain-containing protein [Candidatus Omnitrophica bacterium]|nr:PilZ domain-containing protein [Candidatus Omnitrophota bacterium]
MSQYAGVERRQFKRAQAVFISTVQIEEPFRLRLEMGEEQIHAIMQDLSEGGMGILVNRDIPQASVAAVHFIMFNEHAMLQQDRVRPTQVTGEVRYAIVRQHGEFRLGLRFKGINPGDRAAIAEFVKFAVPI